MDFKYKKSKQEGNPKEHCNKKPNPTNFSNLRSQQYLNQTDVENVSPNIFSNTAEIPKQVFEVSRDCETKTTSKTC